MFLSDQLQTSVAVFLTFCSQIQDSGRDIRSSKMINYQINVLINSTPSFQVQLVNAHQL